MNATLRLWDGYKHTSPHLREAVVELQHKLTSHGLKTSADGFFGYGTQELVEQFQEDRKRVFCFGFVNLVRRIEV